MLWKDWNMKTRIDKDRQSESENSNQLIKRSCGMLLDQWQCATDSTFFFGVTTFCVSVKQDGLALTTLSI